MSESFSRNLLFVLKLELYLFYLCLKGIFGFRRNQAETTLVKMHKNLRTRQRPPKQV